jgi:hypothetical protein
MLTVVGLVCQVHGVIFVVDSSSENAVLQAANVMEESMANELMAGKPLLVYVDTSVGSIS